jgi:hypothetical protein
MFEEFGLITLSPIDGSNARSVVSSSIVAITTDNGANMVACVDLLVDRKVLVRPFGRHVRCVAHTLQLLVSDLKAAVPAFASALEDVKSIVAYFKRSGPALTALANQPAKNHRGAGAQTCSECHHTVG